MNLRIFNSPAKIAKRRVLQALMWDHIRRYRVPLQLWMLPNYPQD